MSFSDDGSHGPAAALEPAPPTRTRRAVDELRNRLSASLMDLSRNNPLLYYRDLKVGRISLPSIEDERTQRLLSGETVPGSSLAATAATPPATATAASPTPAAVDLATPIAQRLSAIRRKARENEEERGLRTLFAGIGMLSWRATDGGRDPMALVVLLPVEIVEDARVRGDFSLRRFEGADATLNPALLQALPVALADRLRAIAPDGTVDDIPATIAALREILAGAADVTYHDRGALGNFSFQLMAMVEDLKESTELLNAHSLVCAIAGDAEAQAALQSSREGVLAVESLDTIPPAAELFVMDADPWQSQAIHTIATPGVAHAIVDGPPGTGKSQTIANLIASLIAQGKTVLFVAEKRAALDVVRSRLAQANLGSLVLDLHGSDATRKQTYAQLKHAMSSLKDAPPAHFDTEDRIFDERRTVLNDHCDFQNTPLPGLGKTPFELLGEIGALEDAPLLRTRWTGRALAALTSAVVDAACERMRELARRYAELATATGRLWSDARLRDDASATAVVTEVRRLRDDGIEPVRAAIRSAGYAEPATFADLVAIGAELATLGELTAFFRVSAFALDDGFLDAAIAAHASPLSPIARLFDGAQRTVRTTLLTQLATAAPERAALLERLRALRAIPAGLRLAASSHPLPDSVALRQAIAAASACERTLGETLGGALPSDVAPLVTRLDGLLSDERSPYVVVRARALEAALAASGFEAPIGELRALRATPEQWARALRRAWLASHLDSIRGRIATFDGRQHDGVVGDFGKRDRDRFAVAGGRVLRAAAERFVAIAHEYPQEQSLFEALLPRTRKLKPIRDLFEAAPHVMSAVAPCVMASPLSVSQFLPRTVLFDYVVFDEGSQVTPENAVTSIVRGRRLVVAGDEHQLPPTSFFAAVADSDDETSSDEFESTLEGIASLLDAVKPFAKPLGLRVHYRSRDERLIAFSNHHVYDDRLVTFPGTGREGRAVSYEYVPPSASEIDEASSAAEVRAVVARVLEHAATRSNESLGVIAMSIKHAQRIQTELDRVRHTRPDLDAFFSETRSDAFFVKNLERVQGDERDAIILSIGYGRTKTGAVSHNFGPVNVSGGERRLNVAITRAKNRILLVSQIRATDLDPNKLTSRGAKLLAAYLRYAESGGDDLGRDRPHDEIALNDFEADIKTTLERRLGWSIVSQYGVGQFRIDLVVQHPDRAGDFVLAIECDGASYHSSPTARLRDRLRQQILEGRGWKFLRIWSTDWFNDRDAEVARARALFDATLATYDLPQPIAAPPLVAEARPSDVVVAPQMPTPTPVPIATPATSPRVVERAGPSPIRIRHTSIDEYALGDLVKLVRWIRSDERIRTDDEVVSEATRELGFTRRGAKIVARLREALDAAQ